MLSDATRAAHVDQRRVNLLSDGDDSADATREECALHDTDAVRNSVPVGGSKHQRRRDPREDHAPEASDPDAVDQPGARGAQALAKLLPECVTRITPSGEERVAISELGNGDLLLVRPGERIPTDCVVRKGESEINEAMIPGESTPVDRHEGDAVIAAYSPRSTPSNQQLAGPITLASVASHACLSPSRSATCSPSRREWDSAPLCSGGASCARGT